MKYKVKQDLIMGKNKGRIDIFIPERSIILSLNETASLIFEKLKKGIDAKTIVNLVVKKYKTTNKQALTDLKSLFKKLEKEKIIK